MRCGQERLKGHRSQKGGAPTDQELGKLSNSDKNGLLPTKQNETPLVHTD